MVCTTLTVGAAYVPTPNISIISLVIADASGYPLPEPYQTTEGDAALLQVTLSNTGDADGMVKLNALRNGVLCKELNWRVNVGATEKVNVWNAYDSSVGVHELCVEIVSVTGV